MLRGLVEFQLRHKIVFWFSLLLVVAVSTFSAVVVCTQKVPKLNIFDSSDLPFNDKVLAEHQRYEKVYEDVPSPIIVAVLAKGPEGIFNRRTLEKIRAISSDLENLTYQELTLEGGEIQIEPVKEVISLKTVERLWQEREGDDILYAHESYLEKIPQETEEIEQIVRDARQDTLVWGKLVSRHEPAVGQAAFIIANVKADVDELRVSREIKEILRPYQSPEEISIYGLKPFNSDLKEAMEQSLLRLLPACFVLLIFVLWYSIRWEGVIISFIIIGLADLWMETFMRLVGMPQTILSLNTAPILLAIVSSYPIHLIGRYQLEIPNPLGLSRDQIILAIAAPTSTMLKPVTMATATTVIGFSSLGCFPIRAIVQFGILVSVGILSAWIIIVLFLPQALYLSWWLRKTRAKRDISNGISQPNWLRQGFNKIIEGLLGISHWLLPKERWVQGVTLCFFGVSLAGLTQLRVGSDFIRLVPDQSPSAVTSNLLRQLTEGDNCLPFVFDTGQNDGIQDPQFLRKVWQLQRELEVSSPDVGYTLSLVDEFDRVCRWLELGEAGSPRLPSTAEGIDQLLWLYESFIGEGRTDFNYRTLQVQVWANTRDSTKIWTLRKEVQFLKEKYFGDSVEVYQGGEFPLWLAQQSYLLFGKGLSFLTAVTVIALLSGLLFHRLRDLSLSRNSFRVILAVGVLTVMPTVFVTSLIFGYFGFRHIYLNMPLCVVSVVAIGVGADFAIHFINEISIQIRAGKSLDEAIKEAINTEGPLEQKDALTNISCFSPLMLSLVGPIRSFGLIISLIMILNPQFTIILISAMRRTWLFKPIRDLAKGLKERKVPLGDTIREIEAPQY